MAAAGQPALAGQAPVQVSPLPDFSARCQALNGVHDPDLGEIISARAGETRLEPNPWNPAPAPLPSHCDVIGKLQPRTGQLGQSYAITYHIRMPQAWNGRFLLQGGGGSNGEIGDATGPVGGLSRAIDRGFAVLSHDSGHDNRRNNDPAHGGVTVFGTDPQARANYGHAALPLVTRAGKSMVSRFYGKRPGKSYFFGCSKGGQEGMALAQRYPGLYDGIVAGAPGFSLPRAALNQAWSLQQFGRLARQQTGQSPTPASIAHTFSAADMQLLARGVLQACDKLDGLADGIVGHPWHAPLRVSCPGCESCNAAVTRRRLVLQAIRLT
jgi:feruloyl esterase